MTRSSLFKKNQKSFAQLAFAGLIAGALSFTACEKTTSSNDSAGKTALEKFKAECIAKGLVYKDIASCDGQGTCAGSSYDITKDTTITHECAGKNTCSGGQCLDPSKMAAKTDEPKETETTITLEKFKSDCTAAGKVAKEHDCKGMADCAGTSFNSATGKVESHECKTHNSCAGASCQG